MKQEAASTPSLLLYLIKPQLLSLVSLALLISNLLFYLRIQDLELAVNNQGFTGIHTSGERWRPFHTYTQYSEVSQSESDAAWRRFTTTGFVAIPHHQAAESGLPLAEDFPDDPSKGVYVLDGFHQLHCVIYLRDTIKDLMAGGTLDPQSDTDGERLVHINHCYDALRQAIQCRADDTPLYIPNRSKRTGDGQLRRCRDWNALTVSAERYSACWPTGHCG
ncbi:hypothetical protein BO99DRAFT_427966 [Aspergillus violaceofuscus CBS 115571]|uniref:Uncharacterized protein n=1 Tax=Aspergillus violaceofuscus (strain CBS 115571) TaxID=1450538 RepID=A0A2V5HIN3_ASPV1|nr:hypothetical protein BO99DRAFT_427966 [Aspergillus violaceofuscus CBS 115571]